MKVGKNSNIYMIAGLLIFLCLQVNKRWLQLEIPDSWQDVFKVAAIVLMVTGIVMSRLQKRKTNEDKV